MQHMLQVTTSFTFKTGKKCKPPHFIIYLLMSPPLVYSLSFGCLKPKQHSEDFHNLNISKYYEPFTIKQTFQTLIFLPKTISVTTVVIDVTFDKTINELFFAYYVAVGPRNLSPEIPIQRLNFK